ncbi:molybdopterin-binding protein [Eubacteriales bacterium OttesenSCG-928-K08]|nr:molybdopterin-binding protein [Eubacteriales bacterium OttesenSCG-928-K08]
MRLVKTEDAVGQVLCHDITRIIKDIEKGAIFSKGHIITEEDIPVLLNIGKDHIYILENDETKLHENDAAKMLRDICLGPNMRATEPKEGKIEIIAECDGLFLVDLNRLKTINSLTNMMIATRPSGFPVKAGDKLCGTRIIPLMIENERMEQAKQVAGSLPLLSLVPIRPKKYGLITTGNEIFYGRIKDDFSPVVKSKLAEYGCEIIAHCILGDDDAIITSTIRAMLDDGAELVLCTGGMSVDPDDRTPKAIRNSGVNVVAYGAPVLPGAMFLLSYTKDNRPVCGLPGCVMYSKRTIFDILLPYLLADVPVSTDQLAALGNGGLCLNCENCHYPNCGFGKGA